MDLNYRKIESPVGSLHLVSDGQALLVVAFDSNWPRLREKRPGLIERTCPVIEKAAAQLEEYFAGKRFEFEIPIRLEGTEFQNKVWTALSKIPFGQTATYQAQAEKLKKPLAVRAVGRANGLNPISIVLPCHRVIGKSGALTGYAGGLEAKAKLLRLEGFAG
jgi:methylated-DNA-[protein]-cysteine S-methyltransferase